MTADMRLVVFDVDGTLVDSQADILASMNAAFSAVGHAAPSRAAILEIVGLSLPQAMALLAPEATKSDQAEMVARYKQAYADARMRVGADVSSPLYPGAREVLDRLAAQPGVLLGIATGKSKRGLDHLLDAHDLQRHFVTTQVADFHPSKPHPAMLETALAEAGVGREAAVMVGDTLHDLNMAVAAQVPFVGVSWGYHPPDRLSQAHAVIAEFDALPGVLDDLWRMADQ